MASTSSTGSRNLLLSEVLYIPTMDFNLLSLQKIIKANCIPVFGQIQDKCIIKKLLQDGEQEQIALLDNANGRLTLECDMAPRTPAALPFTSTHHQFLPALPPTPTSSTIYSKTASPTSTPALHVIQLDMTLLHRRLGHSGQPAIKRRGQRQ